MNKILTVTVLLATALLQGCGSGIASERKEQKELTDYSKFEKAPIYLNKSSFYEPGEYPGLTFFGCEFEADDRMININSVGMVIFKDKELIADIYNPSYSMPKILLGNVKLYKQFKNEWVYRRNVCSFQQEHQNL